MKIVQTRKMVVPNAQKSRRWCLAVQNHHPHHRKS